MTHSENADELFELITPSAVDQPASQALRDAVLRQTTRTVRNRRRMRRATAAGALAACYLGGIATVRIWPTVVGAETSPRDAGTVIARQDQPAEEAEAPRLIRPEDDQVVDELSLALAQLTPYERLRRTGDKQLKQQDDLVAATRTYRKALQVASSDQRSIDPNHDTWLLMSLKQSIN